MDLPAALNGLSVARDLVHTGEWSSASAYYETALQQLNKYIQNASDAYTLGRARDLQKKATAELRSCKEYVNELKELSGVASGSTPQAMRFNNEYDEPRSAAGYDDGYRQPVISHAPPEASDPDIWRPPTRDGPSPPLRIQPARPAALVRARASSEERQEPQWARNPTGAQAVMIPSSNNQGAGGAGGGPRAGSAPRGQQPQVVKGNPAPVAAGGVRGRAVKQEPERAWRHNMAPPPNAKGGAGAGGAAGQAAGGGKKYAGPDPDLAAQLESEMVVAASVRFEDIAGLAEAKQVLNETTILPMLMPDFFTGLRAPAKGVLMYGPPGTGKTTLAKAVATASGCKFFACSAASLGSKYKGESERLVRCLFELARLYAPSVIFFDEVDALCGQRGGGQEHEASRRVKTELLTQIDGIHTSKEVAANERVLVLAATNFPWDIDEAFRRRFAKRVYIPLPTLDDRLELLRIHLTGGNVVADNVDMKVLAEKMDGYSGDDIYQALKDAANVGLRRALPDISQLQHLQQSELRGMAQNLKNEPITQADLLAAIAARRPSVSVDDVRRHEEFRDKFGVT